MIPKYQIYQWREYAPWRYEFQIEQDLVISRALVELYQLPIIQESLAFRGGTALNKLFINPAARYSEDLDFVQIKDEPIGETLSHIRSALDPWLGQARWDQKERSARLIYRFQSEDKPSRPLRLKIEINTVEPFSLYGFKFCEFSVNSEWFSGKATIRTYELEELMATKLRALYQRLKGRDLFDLFLGITQLNMNCEKVINAFLQYNQHHNTTISRAQVEANLHQKINDKSFISDIEALLPVEKTWTIQEASHMVLEKLIRLLPCEPWKNPTKKLKQPAKSIT